MGELGEVRLDAITSRMLISWQSRLSDRYAPFTVLNCRKVCRQAFRVAVRLKLVAANPFDDVDCPPAKAKSPSRALQVDEARALVAAAEGLRDGAAVALLFNQGWRVSEALGLAWDDVDLEYGIALVSARGLVHTVGWNAAWFDEDERSRRRPSPRTDRR